MKIRTKRDWVSTVIEDLKKIDWDIEMEEVRKIKTILFFEDD